jgi:hypothetical protein
MTTNGQENDQGDDCKQEDQRKATHRHAANLRLVLRLLRGRKLGLRRILSRSTPTDFPVGFWLLRRASAATASLMVGASGVIGFDHETRMAGRSNPPLTSSGDARAQDHQLEEAARQPVAEAKDLKQQRSVTHPGHYAPITLSLVSSAAMRDYGTSTLTDSRSVSIQLEDGRNRG